MFKAWTQHLKSGFWHRPRTTSILFLWSNSEVDFLVCFEALSCCIIQLHLSFMFQTDWWTFSIRIFLETAKFVVPSSWTISLPQLCLSVSMTALYVKCYDSFLPDRTWPMFLKKNIYFWLIRPKNSIPKVLGVIKIFFGQLWTNLPWCHAQCLSYCGLLKTDPNWSLNFFWCCRLVTPGTVQRCFLILKIKALRCFFIKWYPATF